MTFWATECPPDCSGDVCHSRKTEMAERIFNLPLAGHPPCRITCIPTASFERTRRSTCRWGFWRNRFLVRRRSSARLATLVLLTDGLTPADRIARTALARPAKREGDMEPACQSGEALWDTRARATKLMNKRRRSQSGKGQCCPGRC